MSRKKKIEEENKEENKEEVKVEETKIEENKTKKKRAPRAKKVAETESKEDTNEKNVEEKTKVTESKKEIIKEDKESEKDLEKDEEKSIEKNINDPKNIKQVEEKIELKNVEENEKNQGQENTEKKSLEQPKTKRICAFSLVGAIVVIAIIIMIIAIITSMGKPSKSKAEDLVEEYLSAVNEHNGEDFIKLVDAKGYIIIREENEKSFAKKYKNEDYINEYMEDKNYDDISDVEDEISNEFKNKYMYSSKEYSLKEITEIKKSSKSNKIIIIKAKVKVKSKTYSTTDTKTMKLYVTKVDGSYKIIYEDID